MFSLFGEFSPLIFAMLNVSQSQCFKCINYNNGKRVIFFLVTKLQLGNALALQALACRDAKRELVAPLRYAAGAT